MRIILKIEFFLIIRALNISYKKKNFSLIRSMIWLFRKYGYNVNKVYELQVIVKYDFAFKAKVDTKQNYDFICFLLSIRVFWIIEYKFSASLKLENKWILLLRMLLVFIFHINTSESFVQNWMKVKSYINWINSDSISISICYKKKKTFS
jgi:hypothetical protein